jgi:hypothetical protein
MIMLPDCFHFVHHQNRQAVQLASANRLEELFKTKWTELPSVSNAMNPAEFLNAFLVWTGEVE